ncbi:MAG: FixH family protein [Bacillota bacterium]
MKKLLLFLLMISIFLLGACGSQENNNDGHGDAHSGEEGELTVISAELNVPETAEAGETVEFSTLVTQGDNKITDASEVKYEIWKEGEKEESEMIEAENREDGHYTAEKTFDEDGVYHVQVHVTAKDMHTMPKKPIAVGDAEIPHESHSSEEEDHDH